MTTFPEDDWSRSGGLSSHQMSNPINIRHSIYLLAGESLADNLGVLVDQHVLDSLVISRGSLCRAAEHALSDYGYSKGAVD